jgi:hypothetical protein
MPTDAKYTGPVNPGSPVTCETPNCGVTYVPVSYEGVERKCPVCHR